MSPAELELLRVALAQSLRATGYAQTIAILLVAAKQAGFRDVTEAAVRSEVQYLADKGLVVADEKTISPENKRWRITAAGRDWLAEEGL